MLLELGNLYTKVRLVDDRERTWLRGYLAFEDARLRYMRRRGGGNSKVFMYNLITDSFPSGLLPLVRSGATREGIHVDVVDTRQKPCAVDPAADLAWLRDYQVECVNKAVAATRGIIWAPTAMGKTEVAVGLSRVLPCQWLFLVHRSTLLEQTAERYEQRTGQQAGRIGDSKWEVPAGCTFVVATFQTLYRKLTETNTVSLLYGAQGVIVDECHTLPSESFMKVAMSFRNAYYRIGLSGTPLARGDKRSLLAVAALGPVIHRIKPDVLIEAGVLAKPKIKMVPVKHPPLPFHSYQGAYGDAIVRSPLRNAAVVRATLSAEKPCLVFVKEVKHGQRLQYMLQKAGLRAEFVYGKDDSTERRESIKRLVRGDADVLVCSVIFQEGVDIPQLRSVVIACGGSSTIAALQRIGRGMRVAHGKTEFDVYDIADKGCGCPNKGGHSGCRWMERHARTRAKSYVGEGYEVTVGSLTSDSNSVPPAQVVAAVK